MMDLFNHVSSPTNTNFKFENTTRSARENSQIATQGTKDWIGQFYSLCSNTYDIPLERGSAMQSWYLAIRLFHNTIEPSIGPTTGADVDLAKLHITVGYMYLDGLGIPQDENEAISYFKIAAEYNSDVATPHLENAICQINESKQEQKLVIQEQQRPINKTLRILTPKNRNKENCSTGSDKIHYAKSGGGSSSIPARQPRTQAV